MLTLEIQLVKIKNRYEAALVGYDNERIIERQDWGKVTLSDAETRKLKIVNLDGKNLAISFRIRNEGKDFTKDSSKKK
jgi:hypothetical protein